jgi:hypothetical protein
MKAVENLTQFRLGISSVSLKYLLKINWLFISIRGMHTYFQEFVPYRCRKCKHATFSTKNDTVQTCG